MNIVPKPIGDPVVKFSGKLLEIISQKVSIGDTITEFENARRPPGTRVICLDGDHILAMSEYRMEIDEIDLRIPGGKVFDTLEEYRAALNSGEDIAKFALEGAARELKEETGYTAISLKPLAVAKCGATIQWDLHYFVAEASRSEVAEQDLGEGEAIQAKWMPIPEFIDAMLNGTVKEDRSLAQLVRFFSDRISQR